MSRGLFVNTTIHTVSGICYQAPTNKHPAAVLSTTNLVCGRVAYKQKYQEGQC